MTTNKAIEQNKVEYLEAGTLSGVFEFDFSNMFLKRTLNGNVDITPILYVRQNDEYVFDVDVLKINDEKVNYVFVKGSNGDKDMMICRWMVNGLVRGWQDQDVKIKKEN